MDRWTVQTIDQIHIQVNVEESSKKTQEEYAQLQFISSLHSEVIPVFETPLRRSTGMVQISQKLLHLNFWIE